MLSFFRRSEASMEKKNAPKKIQEISGIEVEERDFSTEYRQGYLSQLQESKQLMESILGPEFQARNEKKPVRKNPDFSSNPEFESVHRNVSKLFIAMQHQLGLKIPAAEMPSILPAETDMATSYFRPSENAIYIHPEHYGSGIACSEECGHCLRHEFEKKLKIDKVSDHDQIEVDEFFGRLSENLGRSLAAENGLQHLFQEEERNFSEDKKFTENLQEFRRAEILLKQLEEADEKSRQALSERLSAFKGLEDALVALLRELNSNSVKRAEFDNRMLSTITKRFSDFDYGPVRSGSSKACEVFDKKNTARLTAIVKELISLLKATIRPDIDNQAINKLIEQAVYFIIDTSRDLGPDEIITSAREQIKNKRGHLRGYAGAEFFIANNPDWRDKLPRVFRKNSIDVHVYLFVKLQDWLIKQNLTDLLFY